MSESGVGPYYITTDIKFNSGPFNLMMNAEVHTLLIMGSNCTECQVPKAFTRQVDMNTTDYNQTLNLAN